MERIFLAAEAGQRPSSSAVQARQRAVELAWADPSLRAHEGRSARALLDSAAAVVAASVDEPQAQVVFAPSGHAALQWAAERVGEGPLAVGAADRQVVLATARRRAEGSPSPAAQMKCTVDASAVIDATSVQAALSGGAGALASQVGNPEVGSLQPLARLHRLAGEAGVPLLVDATMAAGRLPLPPHWDVLVLDARSWAGGNATAAVVVRPGALGNWRTDEGEHGSQAPQAWPWQAPWVPDVAAAAVSLEQAVGRAEKTRSEQFNLTSYLRTAVGELPQVAVHGAANERLPHIVGFSALYVDAEALILELDRQGFSLASGSACAATTGEPSHVLAAMGALTSGNVRVTLPLAADPTGPRLLAQALGPAIDRLRSEAGL